MDILVTNKITDNQAVRAIWMIDILYIDVPNEYVSRTDASLFVAQIVRTANEMSSTDNATPTNK